jgi:hypothetical protein
MIGTLFSTSFFESFRGGESAFVFSQLLRSYKQSFGANYFEVEPYQFGKNNPEGLNAWYITSPGFTGAGSNGTYVYRGSFCFYQYSVRLRRTVPWIICAANSCW